MQKTPITIVEDLTILEEQSEQEIQKLLKEMEEFFKPVSDAIDPILNPVQQEEQEEVQEAVLGKKDTKKEEAKKVPPKPAKPAKGGPAAQAELAAYESNLPTTSSGIESIVICVDHRFETLPIESLGVFSKASVISRDLNLHLHMNRLKTLEHKAALHNNRGIAKEELKYIVDFPESEGVATGTGFVKDEMVKMTPGSQWEGILTKVDHEPSIGEWQRFISQSSMFTYWSMTCLLHKFQENLISDLSIFNNCRAMCIFDRMNSLKTLIDRDVLTSKHFTPDD